MTLSDRDLDLIIAWGGGSPDVSLIRPGCGFTAEQDLDLMARLKAERDKRTTPAVRPYNPSTAAL